MFPQSVKTTTHLSFRAHFSRLLVCPASWTANKRRLAPGCTWIRSKLSLTLQFWLGFSSFFYNRRHSADNHNTGDQWWRFYIAPVNDTLIFTLWCVAVARSRLNNYYGGGLTTLSCRTLVVILFCHIITIIRDFLASVSPVFNQVKLHSVYVVPYLVV